MVGGWQLVIILVVVLILFGGKKIPELMKGLGEGIREFNKAKSEKDDESDNKTDKK
ncbi:twin-arginine translocase TatA/TatE family subunit [Xiashengella succiniciproducens]|uniref:Sec-independent protein translocase protein TatA n=2 Tax=Xiashengella succiniciproducens TaxID=2949635 RepID=A0A9J6ZTA8_9BACT|nr:twin-arginine translocase TatA/TatE family subunit [Alkaliflexus sp. Ai-910]